MYKPLLIVVTGRPGAGKTTLAGALGRLACLPVLSRDAVKEGLVHTWGTPHRALPEEANLTATNTFFELLSQMLNRGVSVIAEAAFQHPIWAQRLAVLEHSADIRIVVCTPPATVALERFLERGLADDKRLYFHGDKGVVMARQGLRPQPGTYRAPSLPYPTFTVDTSNGYAPALEQLWQQLQAAGRTPA